VKEVFSGYVMERGALDSKESNLERSGFTETHRKTNTSLKKAFYYFAFYVLVAIYCYTKNSDDRGIPRF
jgi:hypothetical protein